MGADNASIHRSEKPANSRGSIISASSSRGTVGHDGNPAIPKHQTIKRQKPVNTKNLLLTLTAASVLPLASSFAKDVALADCPPAVQEVIRSHIGSGKLDDIKRVNVGGRSLYLADIDHPGDYDVKLHISGSGTLLKTREEIALSSAPAAVQEAARKLVPKGGKIDDVEKETANGKVTYMVEIDRPKAPDLKIVFNADGSILSQREERSR
jgi:uncharacterized membrane protein YkoI